MDSFESMVNMALNAAREQVRGGMQCVCGVRGRSMRPRTGWQGCCEVVGRVELSCRNGACAVGVVRAVLS